MAVRQKNISAGFAATESGSSSTGLIDKNKPFVLVPLGEMTQLRSKVPDALEVYGIEAVGKTMVVLRTGSGICLQQDTAPMSCVGFLTNDAEGLEQLSTVRRLFEDWSDCVFPEPRMLRLTVPAKGFDILLATTVLDRLNAYAGHVSRLSRELFHFRTEHENLLNAFAAIEGYLSATNIQPYRMVFENLPASPHSIVSPVFVRQLLPVSSLGLSTVEIHVGDWQRSVQMVAGLSIELRTIEDGQLHETWRLPLEDIVPGWLALPFKSGLVGHPRTPELVIRPIANIGVLPDLALGELQPLRDFQAESTVAGEQPSWGRSLALRLWAGIPGVRPPALTVRLPEKSEHFARVTDVAVPFTMLAQASQLSSHWQPSFQPVNYIAALQALEVHPAPSGVMWARIPNVTIGSIPVRISVLCVVRSADAAPVEFAFAFAGRETSDAIQHVDADWEPAGQPGFTASEWRSVSFQKPALIHVRPIDQTQNGDLYLGTRMAGGASNAFAWACFQSIRLTLLGEVDVGFDEHPNFATVSFHSAGTPPEAMDVLLPETALGDVQNVLQRFIEELALVKYDPGRRGIFCHPVVGGVTLAWLPNHEGADFQGLAAGVRVGSPRSAPIEFGIGVTTLSPAEVLRRLEDERTGHDTSFAFSGWRRVLYDEDDTLQVQGEFIGAGKKAAFLVTRLEEGVRSHDFAWAYFVDIAALTIQPANEVG